MKFQGGMGSTYRSRIAVSDSILSGIRAILEMAVTEQVVQTRMRKWRRLAWGMAEEYEFFYRRGRWTMKGERNRGFL